LVRRLATTAADTVGGKAMGAAVGAEKGIPQITYVPIFSSSPVWTKSANLM